MELPTVIPFKIACRILQCGKKTMRELIDTGKLASIKSVNGRVERVAFASILALLRIPAAEADLYVERWLGRECNSASPSLMNQHGQANAGRRIAARPHRRGAEAMTSEQIRQQENIREVLGYLELR